MFDHKKCLFSRWVITPNMVVLGQKVSWEGRCQRNFGAPRLRLPELGSVAGPLETRRAKFGRSRLKAVRVSKGPKIWEHWASVSSDWGRGWPLINTIFPCSWVAMPNLSFLFKRQEHTTGLWNPSNPTSVVNFQCKLRLCAAMRWSSFLQCRTTTGRRRQRRDQPEKVGP